MAEVELPDPDDQRLVHAMALAPIPTESATPQDCILEIILKDTHTCENRPERFTRWLEIARQEIDRSG